MNGPAVLTMLIICGFIWSGLACLITLALAREGDKQRTASTE